MLVGLSRVVLAVHYPGDVLVGQGIALLTAYGMLAFW
jgi:undecaprenyl-diphosphatase